MLNRLHLSAILLLAAALWGTLLLLEGVAVHSAWLRPFSTVVGVLLLLLVAFDLWAWRLRFLRGWFVPRPDIRGTWHVELRSDWKDPATNEVVAPITAYLVVRQTFSSLSMRLVTSESASELVGAQITKAEDGTYRVTGVYRNEPKLSVRERSPIHYGAIVVDVLGDPVKELVGYYWTYRSTRGEIRTLARNDVIAATFAGAGAALGPTPPKTAASTDKKPGDRD